MSLPNARLQGLHHVTAIARDPRVNLDFYCRVLGQRLVKKTVNFDDPHTYHLYYGDGQGKPGSIMTFFPWPGARLGKHGSGQASSASYAIPTGSLGYWRDRLRAEGVDAQDAGVRFDEATLSFRDPDGLWLQLVEIPGVAEDCGWRGDESTPVDERHAIRGFRGVLLSSIEGSGTIRFLEQVMGFECVAEENGIARFRTTPESADSIGAVLDVGRGTDKGQSGAGTVHHIAFRIADDRSELAWQEHLSAQGTSVSPVRDRQYFRSIYFHEPGGVLFEIATNPPGFAVDEPPERLGSELKLPPGLEAMRPQIEEALPDLDGV